MSYSESEIQESVQTVYLNSKRQAKRALVTNFANGDLNFIGNHCFSYSGTSLVGTSKTQVSEFNSGPNYIVGTISIFCISDTTDDIEFIIELNDTTIMEMNTTSFKDYAPYQPVPIIIPPFTQVTFSAFNLGGGSKNVAMNLTGEVYAGAEVIQGAI